MEVDFEVGELVGLVRVFKASFDIVLELELELLLLFMLFDSGFDVIAGFISRFDVLDFNFVLIFFNLIKINKLIFLI